MTAPGAIPFNPPQIGTTGVLERPAVSPGIQLIIRALQRRQELEQEQQQLAQRRQEFELHKKIAGSQLETARLQQEKDKRAMDEADADYRAKVDAHRIFVGNLPQAGDTAAWGQVIAGVKDERVGKFLMDEIQGMYALQGQGASAEATNLQNQQRILGMVEDRQIHAVLQPLATQDWNQRTISRAISRAIAINPQKGAQVADALGKLIPDMTPHVNENGTVTWIPKQPGPTGGAPLQPKPPDKTQADLGNFATRILNAHARMTELETKNPGIGQGVDDRFRALRTIGAVAIVGKPFEIGLLPSALRTMTPAMREYFNLRMDLGNAILRRATGQQINMEEVDRETAPYVPLHGQGDDILPSIQERRLIQGLTSAESAANGFNPNHLSPGARRLYLESLVPHPGYSPDNPFVKRQPGTTVVPQ